MSLPPLFPKATTAGIVKTSDGERVVASSRRPDGTYRKELKIRPGYTPDEDVTRYRSTRSSESDARILLKGKIPGLTPPVQAAMLGIGAGLKLTKAQKKNSKRKEKRRDGAEGEEEESEDEEPDRNGNSNGKSEDVPDSWESGDEDSVAAVKKVEAVEVKTEEVKIVEESSRVRALKKKLRQAEQLRERETMGLYLPPAEREKVKGIPALEEEISKLAI